MADEGNVRGCSGVWGRVLMSLSSVKSQIIVWLPATVKIWLEPDGLGRRCTTWSFSIRYAQLQMVTCDVSHALVRQ